MPVSLLSEHRKYQVVCTTAQEAANSMYHSQVSTSISFPTSRCPQTSTKSTQRSLSHEEYTRRDGASIAYRQRSQGPTRKTYPGNTPKIQASVVPQVFQSATGALNRHTKAGGRDHKEDCKHQKKNAEKERSNSSSEEVIRHRLEERKSVREWICRLPVDPVHSPN